MQQNVRWNMPCFAHITLALGRHHQSWEMRCVFTWALMNRRMSRQRYPYLFLHNRTHSRHVPQQLKHSTTRARQACSDVVWLHRFSTAGAHPPTP